MLLGEYHQAIDEEGQLLLPQALLQQLGEVSFLTRGLDRALVLYAGEEWRALAGRIMERPISDAEVRRFRRRFFAGAVELRPHRGRILVPSHLRAFAGLNGQVVVAGLYDHLELWSEEHWVGVLSAAEEESAERWQQLGI